MATVSKTKLQNDTALGEDDKQQQIAEIDRQLAELAELEKIVTPATQ